MNSAWVWVGVAVFVVGVVFSLTWAALRSRSDPLTTMGIIVAMVGAVIAVATFVYDLAGGNDPPPTTTTTGEAFKGSTATSEPETTATTKATPTTTIAQAKHEGFRPLPPGSPYRQSGLPHMETVCEDLGRPADAWVPGQVGPHTIVGRKVEDTDQAYHWTCGGPYPQHSRITRDQISKTCRSHKWGEAAYTYDFDNAYSWYCYPPISSR
jgi:hypothetical protein